RDIRRQPPEPGDDPAVGGEVGVGERAVVALAHEFEVALVHLQDRGGGLLRDRQHVLAQRLQGGGDDHVAFRSRRRNSRAANSAAIERPSEKSSRSASSPIASSGQGTTSSSSGSSPGRRSG